MNRNYVIGAISIIVLLIGGLLLYRNYKAKSLTTGKMTQDQITPTPQTTPTSISGRPQVTIKTSKGDVVIELRPDVAPKTVANFVEKFNSGYCEGKTFHRVEDWVVQGCDPLGDGTGGSTTLPTETSTEPFLIGAVGVARKATPKELSNDSQFFIVKKDSQFLDGEYTYFGKVISGMDIVNKLAIGDKITSSVVLTK
jgi:cyclophilin family peptidyl-prolyl cis-trans isomerase